MYIDRDNMDCNNTKHMRLIVCMYMRSIDFIALSTNKFLFMLCTEENAVDRNPTLLNMLVR